MTIQHLTYIDNIETDTPFQSSQKRFQISNVLMKIVGKCLLVMLTL